MAVATEGPHLPPVRRFPCGGAEVSRRPCVARII